MRTYRASALGSCTRAQAAVQLGYSALPTPEFVQGWYDRGVAHEQVCLDAMRADGWDIGGEQALVVLSLTTEAQVEGHLDGSIDMGTEYGRGEEYRCILEIKAPGAWAKFEKAHKTADWSDPLCARYAWQISAYMAGMGMEAVIACYDGDKVRTFGIEVAPYTLDDIRARVAEIESWVTSGELPAACSQNDFPCPVAYLHGDTEARTVIDDPTLAATLRTYQTLNEKVRAGEQAEKARKALKVDMPCGRYDVDGIDLTVYEQKGRTTLDEAAMIAAGIDVEAFRKTGAPSIRWKVGI